MQSNELSTQPAQEAAPADNLCKILMDQIEQTFLTNVRVHAAQNLPASIMAVSLDKLTHLMHRAEEASQAGDTAQLQQLFDELRHFEEPEAVRSYHQTQFMQSHAPDNHSIKTGNM